MPHYVQDRETGKLIEVVKRRPRKPAAPTVMSDIEAFVSPIDKKVVSGRAALRDHQRQHDVALHGEFGENEGREFFERKQKERFERYEGRTPEDREHRRRAIARALDDQRRR